MTTFVQDLGAAARVLRRSPAFTLAAVVTLALGIGANTAIFSIVNSVLLQPLPTAGLDRLRVVREDLPQLDLLAAQLAPAEVLDLAARQDVFSAVTGFSGQDLTMTGQGEPQRITVTATLGDFAGVFGVTPQLGRFYAPEDSREGAPSVAVLSHGLWQQLTGGDRGVIGRSLVLNGATYEVIGVLSPEFRYPRQAQVWVPFVMTPQLSGNRGSLFMETVVRPRPGITDPQLAGHLASEVSRWNELYHQDRFAKRLSSTPFTEHFAGSLGPILLVLMGAVVFVLMIAALNVASLQLVRTTGRTREIAVRSALGAGRARLLRELLLESVLLASVGGALGLWLGVVALDVLGRWAPAEQMYLTEIPLDLRVLGFTALVSLATAIAFGTLPAWRASRVQPQEVLRSGPRGASAGRGRLRLLEGSVVVQVALAVVLLLGSGLMIRTLAQLFAIDPGFRAEGLTTAQVSLPRTTYDTPERTLAFYVNLLEQVRARPGVQDAALVLGLPFTQQTDSSPFDIPSRPQGPGEPERHHEARAVSDGYFEAMGIPLLRGRDFDGRERVGENIVAVIDQTFAEQFFPGEDPVGQRIIGYTGDEVTIIGVAARADRTELASEPKASAYYSYRQLPWQTGRTIVVRSDQPVGAVTSMLRAVVAELDPNVPLFDVQTMTGRIERSLGPRRLALLAFGAFAVLSLLLATLGVYGVMRYLTGQRTREIGIRIAVGAIPREVVGMIVRQGAAITFVGLAIGVLAALWLTQLMAGILFGVSPRDPIAFAGAVTVLAAVAIFSSWLPARSAARVQPVAALRSE